MRALLRARGFLNPVDSVGRGCLTCLNSAKTIVSKQQNSKRHSHSLAGMLSLFDRTGREISDQTQYCETRLASVNLGVLVGESAKKCIKQLKK